MSKKAQQKAAQKRAERKVSSRRKSPAVNHNKWRRGTVGSLSELQKNLNRYGLDNPFDVAEKNSEGAEEAPLDLPNLITKSRETVTNIFRMFSYVAVGAQLADQGQIEYTPQIDLNDAALRIVKLDRRVIRLDQLSQQEDDEVVGYELLDIGGEMDALGTLLYAEVEVMEPSALAIDTHLNAAAMDTFNDPEIKTGSIEEAHSLTLQAVAMTYIQKHIQSEAA